MKDGMIASVRARWSSSVKFLRGRFADPLPSAAPVPEPPADAPLIRPFPWEAHYPAGLEWSFVVAPRPLFALLDDACAAHADRPCLDFLGRKSSYREIGDLVDRAAKGFQALGVGPDVRVGLFLPNCPYYVICFFAVLKAGGTVVNYNPLYAEREIARQIEDSRTSIMVTLNIKGMYPKVAPRLADTCLKTIVVGSMGGLLPWRERTLFALLRRKEIADVPYDQRHVKFKKLIDNDGRPAPVAIDPLKDVAVLQYTGGTTGLPKGAMLTHAALHANTEQVRRWAIGARPGEEKVLGALPLFHVFGMTAVMSVGIAGGFELILMPRFRLDQLLKLIHQERATVLLGVPTMFSAINGSQLLDQYDLSSLRFCISGGAPLPEAVQTTFERLTGCVLVEGYGLTEAGPVCTLNPFAGERRPGSVGLPLPGTLVEIVSLDEPGRRLPLGQRGEICISGPQLMAGFAERPEETAEALRGGRLHTGDAGYIDQDGYVYVIDRIKDLILNGGFNVYPRMVEEAILLHPAIEAASVCGIPDRHRGEVVKAFVKLAAGASLTVPELRAFLRDKLAPFEQPKQIELVEKLPLTWLGKPSRQALVAEELRRLNAAAAAASAAIASAIADGDAVLEPARPAPAAVA
ncbi:MAG TPA: long-chain fatty acid--CoA ligase [Geminicoccaceae bacterium]|nr:long-chain fatty acid--CoA ligase [Geminicoccaceae bacterium]